MLPKYRAYFSDKLAKRYEPIVYSGECMSGNPEAVYYRILQNEDSNELCIQYFYYWKYQNCMLPSHRHDYEPVSSHRHDYEPVYIYLKSDDSNPFLIVSTGFAGPNCHFYKNDIHIRYGEKDRNERYFSAKFSPFPFYPFGKDGNVKYDVCGKMYPLGKDDGLRFEDEVRPLFGIRACSNVFSGAEADLHGHRFDPPLKRLTDRVLTKWYFENYKHAGDMPFGHDVSDPFTSPYIKFLAIPFKIEKNGFEVHLNQMDKDQPYLPIKFEDAEYEVRKNEKGELELYEIKVKKKGKK